MRKITSLILVFCLLLTGIFGENVPAFASTKETYSKTIAIVFDNSGSMYKDGNMAWCRATYAMEVFAAMLNEGDTLLIYPMHPITVGGTEYTMEKPFKVTNASQSHQIRDIFTDDPSGTPVESIDFAAQGLRDCKTDQKYMVILSDGDGFDLGGTPLGRDSSRRELDRRFEEYVAEELNVMYLGIGSNVIMPKTEESEFFVKKQAANSENVLSTLTEICNLIFGRDILPEKYVTDRSVDFDISLKKLIVFVQGENITDLKVTGTSGEIGKQISSSAVKYSTVGAGGRYKNFVPDSSLQGMMVTYENCPAGSYNIEYSGKATSVEVYYEPDADLDFVFTNDSGSNVDYDALYEGVYKVSFGMKDAKTGKLISSELLGSPVYNGNYYINGEKFPITYEGYSGEVPITLNMNDSFKAELTVTYLSGYTITKDSSDFGWPEEGIKIAARPAGELRVEISGGQELYSLQDLKEGKPFIAKVFYKDKQLTGSELEATKLWWDPETSNADIKKVFKDDHYELHLGYKNEDAPEETACGEWTTPIEASYTEKGSAEAKGRTLLTYNILDDFSPLVMELILSQDYILISEIEESEPILVNLYLDGAKLSPEDFANTVLTADCEGINCELVPNEQKSSYELKLLSTEKLEEGKYHITVTADYTDHIGRTTQTEQSTAVTMSNIPLWVKWTVSLFLLLLLLIIIWLILHIRVLPKNAHVNKRDSAMIFDGEDETKATTFDAKMSKGQMTVSGKYAGTKSGIIMGVKPGKESYLMKPKAKRSAEVNGASVRKMGNVTINEAMIGSIKYVLNEENGKLERIPKSDKPFLLKHGTPISYSGTMLSGGVPTPFTVNTKLNFKKK